MEKTLTAQGLILEPVIHCQPERRGIIVSPHPVVFSRVMGKKPFSIKCSNLGTLFTQPTAARKGINDLQPGM